MLSFVQVDIDSIEGQHITRMLYFDSAYFNQWINSVSTVRLDTLTPSVEAQ